MKPYDLVGVDGNAFAVMGYVSNAMRRSGFTSKERDEYLADAQSDGYNHLLAVSVDMVEKVNEKLRQEGVLDEDEEDW